MTNAPYKRFRTNRATTGSARPNSRTIRQIAAGSFSWLACHFCVIALLVGSVVCTPTNADTGQWASEYDLRSAFIFNIISFVDLPQSAAGSRLILGFAGEGPMPAAMARFFADKRIGSHPIEVRVVHTARELRACNVLLLGYPDRSRTSEALAELHDSEVLTIGDGEDFAALGGIVALVPHDNTFGLAVNPHAAERARLKISSKLLRIAKLVPDDIARGRE